MAKATAISDEEIIAALLQHGTIKDAAEAVGIAPRTIYDRMQQKAFVEIYQDAKTDIMRAAVHNLDKQLSAAVDAVAGIMTDQGVNPAVRLQAAQTILNTAGKFSLRLEQDENKSREIRRDFLFDLFK